MSCNPEILRKVPLFALLDDDEITVLASQVEYRKFTPRQRIYKIGDPSKYAYILVSGVVKVTTVDEDQQEVILDQPGEGEFFGFSSMLSQTPHTSEAVTYEETECIEMDRNDIEVLLHRKPDAGLDLLITISKQFQTTQQLIRIRAARNPNELIEEDETFGEHVADIVASFGGSWGFIIFFAVILLSYTLLNIRLGHAAWDPYPFILLNLFLSMLAAIQAPIIMMSQNRQDKKDRLRSELDFDVNRRAHTEIQGLANKINLLNDKTNDIVDLLHQIKTLPNDLGECRNDT
ncbi:MAG: DUF1003 domain-containing protein [Pseudomonadota bacterium]|nr:DUF1003 domain-containing protein [Pseudomonadota bacterium]